MKEDFIAYIWKNRLVKPSGLYSCQGEEISVVHPGQENRDAGPDFLSAKIRIGNTLWAGNVELHVRASDWQRHNHHTDPAYDNVILHVVYTSDKPITNSKGDEVPCLELKNDIEHTLLKNYQALQRGRGWIPCQNSIGDVDAIVRGNWLNRLLVERLSRRTTDIYNHLIYFKNDWETLFFYLLAKNFGFKINAMPFGLLAQKTPLHLLQKLRNQPFTIEAVLQGQAGFLQHRFRDVFPKKLQEEYLFQKRKYSLTPMDASCWKFCRTRPTNFPTIRISQMASLISLGNNTLGKVRSIKSPSDIMRLYQVCASEYWNNHYRFDVLSGRDRKKCMGTDSITNIIINTIVPVLFLYGKETLNPEMTEKAFELLHLLKPEQNHIIKRWCALGMPPQHAGDSQALLELKKHYCLKKDCLRCPIGNHIIHNGTI